MQDRHLCSPPKKKKQNKLTTYFHALHKEKGNIKHQQINGTPPFPTLTKLGNHETSANSISVAKKYRYIAD
jgi:hypothetical protein